MSEASPVVVLESPAARTDVLHAASCMPPHMRHSFLHDVGMVAGGPAGSVPPHITATARRYELTLQHSAQADGGSDPHHNMFRRLLF